MEPKTMIDVYSLPEAQRQVMLDMLMTNWALGGDGTLYWDKATGQLTGPNQAPEGAVAVTLNSDLVSAYAHQMRQLKDAGFIEVADA